MGSDPVAVSTAICGLGAATPIGRTAWASAAAVRAGLSGFGQHAFMVDSAGEPMQIAACTWLNEPDIAQRLACFLVEAVEDACQPLSVAGPSALPRSTLLVALPGVRPGADADLSERVEAALVSRLGKSLHRVVVFSRGHASGLLAVDAALRELQASPNDAFVVAGADCWLDLDTLEWLEETDQLHAAGERNNAWGFVPGEGGGAVLLLSTASAERLCIPVLAKLTGCGVATEKNLIRSGSVCLGEGLTAAVRLALKSLPEGAQVTDVYCDMNGDPYRADEYGFTVTRTKERFVAASEFVAPADCWGDVGAASAALALVLATIAPLKGYARGPTSLVWASSDTGERGALVVQSAAP